MPFAASRRIQPRKLNITRKAARLDPKLFALCLRWRLISSMTNLLPAADRQNTPHGRRRASAGIFWSRPRVDFKPIFQPRSRPPPLLLPRPCFPTRRVSRQTTAFLRRDHRCRRAIVPRPESHAFPAQRVSHAKSLAGKNSPWTR